MKLWYLFLILLPLKSFTQKDSVTIKSNKLEFRMPVNESKQVVYDFIEKFDSTISDETIYQNFKYTLSVLTKQSSIGVSNPLFKVNTSNDPLLFENKESRHLIFQFMFRSVKTNDDPDEIVPDMVIFTKIDVRIKNHRVKVTFKDVDLYFTSTGLAIVGGAENSMVNIDFNQLLNQTNNADNNNEDGIFQYNNYSTKRIFTTDYKLKNKISQYIFNAVRKNMKESDF